MITDVEYMQLITEEYDLSDYATKKKLLFCNEANKALHIESIVTRLYQHIKRDSTGIDFGSIPKSKGDITKVENYEQMLDCLNSIAELVKNYKDPTTIVKEIYTAIDNVHNREREFTKAYTLNIEFPIMIYNSIVLSIVSSISLLISSSIEFIKNGHDSFNVAFDKVGFSKTKDHLMFEYVTQFNRNCANGTIDKAIKECVKNNLVATNESVEMIDEGISDVAKKVVGAASSVGSVAHLYNEIKHRDNPDEAYKLLKDTKLAQAMPNSIKTVIKIVSIIIALGIALINLVKLLAKLYAYYIKTSMKVSDWFSLQAQYLQINAENLKYRDDPKGDDHKKEVYQRQMKWVDRFKKIANKLNIVDSKSRKEVDDEDNDKRTYDDDDDNNSDDDDGLF